MHKVRRANDAVLMYMSELGARVVAESGRAEDMFHLGKLTLRSLKDDPGFVLQIDAATDESETNASVLERSVKCAISLKNLGLQCGDVIVLMAPNHVDLAIPFYAALYLGVTVAPVDMTLTVNELKGSFDVNKPKAIFCQSNKASDIQLALNELELNAAIITFDKGDYLTSFAELLDRFGDDMTVENFKATDFDPEDTIAVLIPTSGTTGLPKSAAGTHKNFTITGPYWWSRFDTFPGPTKSALVGSPLQWLTALLHVIMSPILRYTRLQSALPLTRDHAYHVINTYKPSYSTLSPTFMISLIRERDKCDFTCFEVIYLGGSAVSAELLAELQEIAPNTEFRAIYGMSEMTSIGLHPDDPPPDSVGKPLGCHKYRIVDITTQQDVTEPHKQGELWVKGPGIFKEYYNNPKAVEESFAEDRWFKTGDIFYRDENWNMFFVERYKLLLKYMSHHISPVEVENVIRQHPGVLDVAVTGIPDPECGDLPVACVVRRTGHDVTAEGIKYLVKANLADSKQLRGGVVFLKEIPMTTSTKVHRRKLKEAVLHMQRE
ncbi:luciferin 4-monooxygenase-like [Pectinophora gossypiella]|uniref:luciferin 4-monooxygenase-like n=1 Tax=Pectinophora gossypiella TaxID=13191 RepID=UPI00214F3B17|nr:luciferin 4-monooxygenase-like [Pectinophora gossypiella]